MLSKIAAKLNDSHKQELYSKLSQKPLGLVAAAVIDKDDFYLPGYVFPLKQQTHFPLDRFAECSREVSVIINWHYKRVDRHRLAATPKSSAELHLVPSSAGDRGPRPADQR